MMIQDIGLLSIYLLIAGFNIGRATTISLILSIIPLTFAYVKFKQIKKEVLK